MTNTATVAAAELDPNVSNNVVATTVLAIGGVDAELSSLMIASEDAVAAADDSDNVDIQTLVLDRSGSPVPGATVILTSTALINLPPVMTTNDSGWVIGSVTSNYVGSAEIKAIANGVIIIDTVTVTFQGADVAIRASGSDKAIPGQTVLYDITVENNGLIPAEGVVVTDTLPIGISYLSHSVPVATPVISKVVGSQVIWEFQEPLNGGASRSFSLVGRVADTLAAGETVENRVEVTSLTADEDPANNVFTNTATAIQPYSHTLTVSPDTLAFSVGATGEISLTLTNTGPLADVYTMTVAGLDPAWYTAITDSFALTPGAFRQMPLRLRVSDCTQGTVPFTITAWSQEGQLAAEAMANLAVQANPRQSGLFPPDGSKSASRSVLFGWRTDAPTTGTLTLASTGQVITRTTPLSNVHQARIDDLDRSRTYTWTVESVSTCGQTVSPVQNLAIGQGIVFGPYQDEFVIKHDYEQLITLTVKNEDMQAHKLRVRLDPPPDDLIANFVGSGSIDDGSAYISLEPGQSRPVVLVIHAQDAQQERYTLTAQVVADETEPDKQLVDYANINLRVLAANQFELALFDINDDTLVHTYVVTNTGYPLTDLSIEALDPATGLPARVLVQPTLTHARLAAAGEPGSTLAFEVIPLFSPEDAIAALAASELKFGGGLAHPLPEAATMQAAASTGITVQLVASAGGNSHLLTNSYACTPPNQLYAVTLPNVRLNFNNGNWYCTNRPYISLNLNTPGTINNSSILSATLSSTFGQYGGAPVRPHNMQLFFNSRQIASFTNQVPFGTYFFSLDPSDLKPAASPVGTVNQVVTINSQHPNGGHYQVNSATRLSLLLSSYTQYVCAANAQDAVAAAQQNTLPSPTSIDIQFQQPAAGAELELNQPVTLAAAVNDYLDSHNLPYPAEVVITYQDAVIDGQPYKETLGLPYISSSNNWDSYRATWTPIYTGSVAMTAVVDAVTARDSDTITVNVKPEPADLKIKVLALPEQLEQGETVEVQAEVTNLSGAIDQEVTIRFEYFRLDLVGEEQGASANLYVEWPLVDTQDLPVLLDLGPGESTVISDTFTIPETGSYQVVITADP